IPANLLKVGQSICIPNGYNNYNGYNTYTNAYPTYNSYGSNCANYVIRAGDTCSSLSQGSLNNFNQLNPGINCNNLQIGQSVCVPYGSQTNYNNGAYNPAYNTGAYNPAYNTGAYNPGYACSGRSYTVQAGDTCYSIAQRYGTTTANVQSCIGVNCSNLQVGQVITF
ncbi:peptidoglycan-binding, partial [Brachionus plicatilis]